MQKRYESGDTDEQLILQCREGNDKAMDELLGRYKDAVRIKANSMFLLGGEKDDLIQEGMIGLLKAIRDYDFGRDAMFKTFAELCISRQIYTAVQASSRKKHMPLNNYTSIYADEDKSGDKREGAALSEGLPAPEISDPEQMMIDKENVKHIYEVIDEELSPFEKQVLELKMTGMDYVEIAKVLGRDTKSTDNALNRVKNKLRGKLL
ncbi:MAG: sigma-70 family RNA polymerase sigma factor [Lachnospiraceae bacterium]|nr:sigma-70 family RNA polymerase sigma factor [Lachnospiraceae bacterium]